MAIYSLALRTTVFTGTSTANWQILAAASVRPKILELSYIQLTAVASQIGLATPNATANTPTNVLFLQDDPADVNATTNGAIAWNTSPTAPVVAYKRRWNGTLASVGVVWTFPRGLVLAASGTFVLWNIATTVAADVNCVIDE
jgi:hypothetical protein